VLAELGQSEASIAVLEALLEGRDDLPQAHLSLGILYERSKRLMESKAAYAKAVEGFEAGKSVGILAPEERLNRAIALDLLRGKVAELKEVNDILQAYPQYKEAKSVKARISRGERLFFMRWVGQGTDATTEQVDSIFPPRPLRPGKRKTQTRRAHEKLGIQDTIRKPVWWACNGPGIGQSAQRPRRGRLGTRQYFSG
jgi:tetratricopeptide (TPR) repeat protein